MVNQSRTVLLYTHALTGGGAERVWALLASALSARGHRVTFVTDFAASENKEFLSDDIRQIVLPEGHFAAVRGLARLLAAEKPDVSISALGVSNLKHMLAAILARRLPRSIVSMHGYYRSEKGYLSRIGNALTPIIGRISAATICVSDGLLRYFVQRWGLPPAKAVRIYNPVIVTANSPPAYAKCLEARAPIVLAVGRLIEYKNYPMLLDAFADLKTEGALLKILGEGPNKPQIEAKIAQMGLSDRVELLGYHPTPWQYYEQARCFALPSNFESFGNVIVEALAQGLPVIATVCHGPLEIINADALGILVPIGDSHAMAAAIDKRLADPQDPTPRIQRAQDFTSETAAIAYEAVFETVIARAEKLGR